MKKLLILIGIISSELVSAQVKLNPEILEGISAGDKHFHGPVHFHSAVAAIYSYRVRHYTCFWNVDPDVRQISGYVTVDFQTTKETDTLSLDLSGVMSVDSVTYHGQQAAFTHNPDVLHIIFSPPFPSGHNDSVTVYYHGVPVDDDYGTFVQQIHNGTPVISTLSEPYGASNWWPCRNDLTDKTDSVDIFIRTPSAYKGASNGILVSETVEGVNRISHWKHRYPIATYLVCLAVSNYSVFSQQVPFGNTSLPLMNYVYPEDSAQAVSDLQLIVPMIQLYDSLFGIYPFQNEKYGHVQYSYGGGMEHQTMTFVKDFQFELIAHELAHQWFGDKVTCGSWHDIWLNEGFATYLSGLCYEHLAPDLWVQFRKVRVKKIISEPGGTVYCTDTTSINRIFDSRLSYAKGAMILHQLRLILGDQAFFSGLYSYINDFSLAYGFARTYDLKSHLERASGKDLTIYFNKWFTGEGFPSYSVNWSQSGNNLTFTLKQTQSVPSVPFFDLPVELEFRNSERDSVIRFNNTFSGESFSIYLPFQADTVIFDPNYQIISGNNTVNAVNEHELNPEILVFPNPASDHVVFVPGEYFSAESCKLTILDSFGRIRDQVKTVSGQKEIHLMTATYSAGLYFYEFSGRNYDIRGKFLIR